MREYGIVALQAIIRVETWIVPLLPANCSPRADTSFPMLVMSNAFAILDSTASLRSASRFWTSCGKSRIL